MKKKLLILFGTALMFGTSIVGIKQNVVKEARADDARGQITLFSKGEWNADLVGTVTTGGAAGTTALSYDESGNAKITGWPGYFVFSKTLDLSSYSDAKFQFTYKTPNACTSFSVTSKSTTGEVFWTEKYDSNADFAVTETFITNSIALNNFDGKTFEKGNWGNTSYEFSSNKINGMRFTIGSSGVMVISDIVVSYSNIAGQVQTFIDDFMHFDHTKNVAIFKDGVWDSSYLTAVPTLDNLKLENNILVGTMASWAQSIVSFNAPLDFSNASKATFSVKLGAGSQWTDVNLGVYNCNGVDAGYLMVDTNKKVGVGSNGTATLVNTNFIDANFSTNTWRGWYKGTPRSGDYNHIWGISFGTSAVNITEISLSIEYKGIEKTNVIDTNACRSTGDGALSYYAAAKEAYTKLSDEAKELFCTSKDYEDAFARLQAWANANGDSIIENIIVSGSNNISLVSNNENKVWIAIVVVSIVSVSILAVLVVYKKRKAALIK